MKYIGLFRGTKDATKIIGAKTWYFCPVSPVKRVSKISVEGQWSPKFGIRQKGDKHMSRLLWRFKQSLYWKGDIHNDWYSKSKIRYDTYQNGIWQQQ